MTDSKKLSAERYGQYAQGYVHSATHAKGYDLDQLVALAQPQAAWRMLDVATGGGHTALKFAPHVAEVVATDLTPQMVAAAQTFVHNQGAINVRFEVADAENLPFAAASFDLVTCRIAAHHFPHADQFVREAARVVKVGGVVLVQDHVLAEDAATAEYTDRFEWVRDPSHHQAFTESAWRAMFTAAGLTVAHTEHVIKRHPFYDWVARQGNSPEVVAQLLNLLRDAPPAAAEWLAVENWGTPNLSFVNHHLIIMGHKAH